MNYKIKNIAEIQMGYSFRARIEQDSDGDVAVVQMKDLADDNTVNLGDVAKTVMPDVKEHHFLKEGDLIFRSRGLLSTSAIYLGGVERAVVAAPLIRIRVSDTGKVLPEYLNWYIAQKDAQVFFSSRGQGTSHRMIDVETIGDLQIPLPTLDVQRKIVELADLACREKIIMNTLAIKYEQKITKILMHYAKGE